MRGYEVTEAAVVQRTYIVFARTRAEAREKVVAGRNAPHPHNMEDYPSKTWVSDVRRAPDYDDEAKEATP